MKLVLLITTAVAMTLVPAALSGNPDEKSDQELYGELRGLIKSNTVSVNVDTVETCGLKTKSAVPKTHTACLKGRSKEMVERMECSTDQIKEIVDQHNKWRSEVSPKAANMLKLEWDDELAMVAMTWAAQCTWYHDSYKNRNIPGKYHVGQNMFREDTKSDKSLPWSDIVNGWHSEVGNFQYGHGRVNRKKTVVGHYTQVVAAKTTKVGCGAAKCRHPWKPNWFRVHSVCNYAIAGNMRCWKRVNKKYIKVDEMKKPYKYSRKSCSDCPNHCENNLCVCKNTATTTNICYNRGEVNAKTCKCNCAKSPFSGLRCDVCRDRKDKLWGKYGYTCAQLKAKYGLRYCKFNNVKRHCCTTCSP